MIHLKSRIKSMLSKRRRRRWITPRKISIEVVSTRCKDDLHVIFWDFDFSLPEPILHELSIIQSTYNLSNIYILKTARGFHGICLTKFHWSDMMKIVANTRLVDRLFILGIVRNFRGGLRYEGGLNTPNNRRWPAELTRTSLSERLDF